MAFRNRVLNQRAHITTLYIAWGLTALIAAGLWVGWVQATRTLPVLSIPPDLSRGATIRPGEHQPANVYAFALTIWQSVNRWEENGHIEYPQQLFRYRPYMTPAFYEDRRTHMARKAERGELNKRKRALVPLPGVGYAVWRVEVVTPGTWRVWLDLRLEEHHGATTVKAPAMRYPLTVTVYDVDRARNPFGLALAGFAGHGPKRLTDEELLAVKAPAPTGGPS